VQHDETSLLLTFDKQRWQAEIGSRVARSGDLGRCGDRVRMGCWWLCIRFVHKIASALDRAVWCPAYWLRVQQDCSRTRSRGLQFTL
jgi:hypothetical protein